MIALVDTFAPPERRSDSEYMQRMRVAVVYCAVLSLCSVVWGIGYWLAGAPALMAASTVFVGLAGGLTPILLRIRVPLSIVAVAGTALMISLQIVQIYIEGPRSWAHAWLIAAPLIAQNIGGFRAGLVGMAGAISSLLGMAYLRSIGAFSNEPLSGFEGADVTMDMAALLVVVVALGSIPVRFERNARAAAESANKALTAEVQHHRQTQVQLQQAQGDLVRAARFAGMAEVATGVLHNMGNALNTVAVNAQVVRERVATDDVADRLERIQGLLNDHPDKAAPTAEYLGAMAEHRRRGQQTALTDLDRLIDGVGHVADVVAAQQRHARSGGLIEEVSLPELVEQVIQLTRPSLSKYGVSTETHVPPIQLLTESHQVVQILSNIIRNAADALADAPGQRKVVVHARQHADEVFISVTDTGPGIPEPLRARVFEHGFTTKESGSGFGLHVSALAARSIGGSLSLNCERTLGAEFVLTLPVRAAA